MYGSRIRPLKANSARKRIDGRASWVCQIGNCDSGCQNVGKTRRKISVGAVSCCVIFYILYVLYVVSSLTGYSTFLCT